MERLEEKYKDTVIRRRNMWLFFIKDAKNVIADCQAWNIAYGLMMSPSQTILER